MVRFVTSMGRNFYLRHPNPDRMAGMSISYGRSGIYSTWCRKAAERRGTPSCNTMISYRFVKQFAIGARLVIAELKAEDCLMRAALLLRSAHSLT